MSFPYLAVRNEAAAPAAPLVRVNQKVLQVAREAAARKLWRLGVPIAGEWAPPPLPPANVVCVNQHPLSDLAMGLTEFAEGAVIAAEDAGGGDAWLAVHLAVCAGRPPIMEDCVDWVSEHEGRWRGIVADPLASDYWQSAPKPWQCLAAIFEWVAFADAGYGFVSHLPVSVDFSLQPLCREDGPLREVHLDDNIRSLAALAAVDYDGGGWMIIGVGPGVFATHAATATTLSGRMWGVMDYVDKMVDPEEVAATVEGMLREPTDDHYPPEPVVSENPVAEVRRPPEFKTAVAWAVASMQPAREGSLGFYACGWAISYDGGKTWPIQAVSVSEKPDGDSWSAGIIAIRKVLEAVDPHTSLTINVRNKTLADCCLAGWRDGRGKPQAGADVAQSIFDLKASKRLTSLNIQQAPPDKMATSLLKRAKAAAKERDAALTPAERRAVPGAPGAQPKNQTGGFPPIDENGNDLP